MIDGNIYSATMPRVSMQHVLHSFYAILSFSWLIKLPWGQCMGKLVHISSSGKHTSLKFPESWWTIRSGAAAPLQFRDKPTMNVRSPVAAHAYWVFGESERWREFLVSPSALVHLFDFRKAGCRALKHMVLMHMHAVSFPGPRTHSGATSVSRPHWGEAGETVAPPRPATLSSLMGKTHRDSSLQAG